MHARNEGVSSAALVMHLVICWMTGNRAATRRWRLCRPDGSRTKVFFFNGNGKGRSTNKKRCRPILGRAC